MQRQKTAEELEQERRDEEFARQLQVEMMAENANTYANNGVRQAPPQQSYAPPPAAAPTSRVTCQYCRSMNNIPINAGTTQFLCGHCKRLLGFNQGPVSVTQQQQLAAYQNASNYPAAQIPQQQQQQRPQSAVNNNQPIYQGSVQGPTTIQVRCGQCSVVNAVQRQKPGSLQFMCGSCQSVNEVNV